MNLCMSLHTLLSNVHTLIKSLVYEYISDVIILYLNEDTYK